VGGLAVSDANLTIFEAFHNSQQGMLQKFCSSTLILHANFFHNPARQNAHVLVLLQ
jgi:hypothetical protein